MKRTNDTTVRFVKFYSFIMNWYGGEIPDAIKLAKTSHSVMIIYITGDDDKSKASDALWEDKEVIDACANNDNVALKLKANSESCKQFSAIYPVVVVPSAYFIGVSGIPLDVIACDANKDEFVHKIRAAFKKHEASRSPPTPTVATNTPQRTTGPPDTQLTTPPSLANDVSSTPESHESASLSQEEKIQRASDLIEEKQIKQSSEEKEKEKEKELERRDLGRSAAKLDQMKNEHDTQEMKKQWRKDKEADRLARERVREQIAQDRADKSEAYQRGKAAAESERQEAKRIKLEEEQKATREVAAQRSETARLQFRLPDGSSVTRNFAATDTLRTAYQFIAAHMHCERSELTLVTTYPRRSFTDEEQRRTLRDLELAPSAVILVIPAQRTSTQSSTNPFHYLVSLMFAPFSLLWSYVYGFLFGFPAVQSSQRGAPQTTTTPTDAGRDREVPGGSTGARNRPQTAYMRRTPNAEISRTEGNIHRFRQQQDDDDDNATWNGNSTQQM